MKISNEANKADDRKVEEMHGEKKSDDLGKDDKQKDQRKGEDYKGKNNEPTKSRMSGQAEKLEKAEKEEEEKTENPKSFKKEDKKNLIEPTKFPYDAKQQAISEGKLAGEDEHPTEADAPTDWSDESNEEEKSSVGIDERNLMRCSESGGLKASRLQESCSLIEFDEMPDPPQRKDETQEHSHNDEQANLIVVKSIVGHVTTDYADHQTIQLFALNLKAFGKVAMKCEVGSQFESLIMQKLSFTSKMSVINVTRIFNIITIKMLRLLENETGSSQSCIMLENVASVFSTFMANWIYEHNYDVKREWRRRTDKGEKQKQAH